MWNNFDDFEVFNFFDENENKTTVESTCSFLDSVNVQNESNFVRPGRIMNMLLSALNSCDPATIKSGLTKVAHPSLTLMKYCYANPDDRQRGDPFYSFAPVQGFENIARYWMGMSETIPDCILILKSPLRRCAQTKEEVVYIAGIEMCGTTMTFTDHYPHYTSYYYSPPSFAYRKTITTLSINKKGSMIIYLNREEKFIYRIDLYLEY